MKKPIRLLLLIFGSIFILLLLLPFLFRDRLAESVKKQINKELNATVDFEEVDLHLFRNFPSLSLEMEGLSVVNKAPFEGDTLFYAKHLYVDLPWNTIFSGGVDPYTVSHFRVESAGIKLISDEEGRVNYDIAKKEAAGTVEDAGSGSSNAALTLERYELEDINLVYEDRKQGLYMELDSLYHRGSGDLSAGVTVLSTETSTLLTMVYDETTYLNRNSLDWKADLEMDLENMTFTFKDNEAHINRLPLVFNGGVALLEEGTDFNLDFKTPSSDFKQFLSLIPEKYSGNLEGIDASGKFAFHGEVSGMLTDEKIPQFSVNIEADDAYFKYSGMPLSMNEINMKGKLANTTSNVKDTYMQVDTLHFELAGDRMDMHMMAEELGGNPRVDMNAKGVLNLQNFSKLMPSGTLEDLSGILSMDMRSRFDMEAIEKEAYEQVRNEGKMEVKDLKFKSDYLPKEMLVENASLALNSKSITLHKAEIRTGDTDLLLKGTITDYLNALSDKGVISGKLDMESNTLVVADLVDLSEEEAATESTEGNEPAEGVAASEAEALFPANLDMVINGKAQKVVYDDIELKDARAGMHLADQHLEISELSSGVFGGRISLDGLLKGETAKPEYNMNLEASGFDFASAFSHMDILKNLVPVARAFNGDFNGKISLSGLLGEDLSPVLNSLTGDLLGELKVAEVKEEELGFMSSLNSKMAFVDLKRLTGKELEAALDFSEGQVRLRPVAFNFNGMDAELSGGHEFNGSMDYALKVNVPASYLGDEVTKLASSLNVSDLDKRTIPVEIQIGGALKQPSFQTNLDKAMGNFVAELAQEKKNELAEKGKSELGNLVNKVLGNDSKEGAAAAADTTATTKKSEKDVVKEAAGNILNNLFNKKKKDTTNNR